uniref:DFRP_C domain-containing protein n=1 Tax=Gongylonema pulchrum TaxID=637853 RepID=A0A183DK35_9BILA
LLERNTAVADDERITKRFAAERLKFFESNKRELADNGGNQLTHKGKALTEIEKYDHGMLSEEDDDDEGEMGDIGADVVAATHFGGGGAVETATIKRLGS